MHIIDRRFGAFEHLKVQSHNNKSVNGVNGRSVDKW